MIPEEFGSVAERDGVFERGKAPLERESAGRQRAATAVMVPS